MDIIIPSVIGVAALIIGILIGRKPISYWKDIAESAVKRAEFMESLKKEEEDSKWRVVGIARTLHAGCKNDDQWSDHTREHPEGLTPERRGYIAKEEERKEAAHKAALEYAAKRRKEEEAKRRSNGLSVISDGGSTATAGAVFTAVVDTGFSSCDSGSAACD